MDAHAPGQAKVCNLDLPLQGALSHDQHVGWLEVSVHDAGSVQSLCTGGQLPHEALESVGAETSAGHGSSLSVSPHHLEQIVLGILKYEAQAWLLNQNFMMTNISAALCCAAGVEECLTHIPQRWQIT